MARSVSEMTYPYQKKLDVSTAFTWNNKAGQIHVLISPIDDYFDIKVINPPYFICWPDISP